MKRITLIVGHYGSGKTEFSVNHVINLKKQYDKVAILDMDIANPYFRSRERQEFLEDMGIAIHFNSFGYDITEDLPAISACMKAPLENKDYMVVADVGGDNAGARVLNQFKKYFVDESDCEMLIVVNANRPETANLEGALYHIRTIEAETARNEGEGYFGGLSALPGYLPGDGYSHHLHHLCGKAGAGAEKGQGRARPGRHGDLPHQALYAAYLAG